MNDSFDDELFADSEPSEVHIESNSQEVDVRSIDAEEKDVFAEIITKTLKDVMSWSKYSEREVILLSDAVSKRCDSNWAQTEELILSLLAEVAEIEWCEGSKCVIRLFAAVAIRMMKEKQMDAMWNMVQTHSDQTCFCVMESIRLHGCLVICECLRLVNEKVDEERNSQESEENDLLSSNSDRTQNEKLYTFIPRKLVERWGKVLSQRRLDKSSNVRAIGVAAVGDLPHSTLLDYECNEFIPNDMVLSSLRDVDAKVREASIKAFSLLSADHIEYAINRLKCEEKPEIGRLLAAKLIQEVHVMSFSEEQRANLLVFLFDNKDRILARMARERLIPKWEKEQDGDSALNSLFNPQDEEALKMYISTLFADDLKKSENEWEFVEVIKEENPEMINIDNWEKSITRLSASELSYGVLLLESTFYVLSSSGDLSSCLSRLVPSLADVCRSMKQVSVSWLWGSEVDRQEEKIMVRILKLVARFDRFDSDGMCEWESLLRYLILSPEVKPSKILVEQCMEHLIRVFGSEKEKKEEIREWTIDQMDQLVFEGEKATEDDSLKWRCSLILHSLVKHLSSLDEKTADFTSRLMENTFISQWDMQREINIKIITIVGCLNKDWLEGKMIALVKTALDLDDDPIKMVCLRGLVDLTSIHSPPIIASLFFPDWNEEVIKRETKLYQLFEDYSDPTSKSLISQTAIHCTLRLVREWTPPCPILIYNLLIFTTRENEGERAALEKAVIEEMKRQLERSRPFRLLVAHSMYCLMERQRGVNAYKCSIGSTLMKSMMLLRSARREEEVEDEDENSVDFEEWLVPMIILDAIIEDPESNMNRVLVNSLACLKKDDGGDGLNMMVKKMENAIERLAIYEEAATSKILVKIYERLDGRSGRKRKMGGEKKKGRKRVKKEMEERDGSHCDVTHQGEDDPMSDEF